MALFITFGTSLIQKVGMVEVIRAVADAKGRFGLFWLSMSQRTNCGFLFTIADVDHCFAGDRFPAIEQQAVLFSIFVGRCYVFWTKV